MSPSSLGVWTYGSIFVRRVACADRCLVAPPPDVIWMGQAVAEIMEKEGSALADRPYSTPADLLCNDLALLLLHSGERLRRFRKAVSTHLQPKAARAYRDLQLENAKNVITDILDDPKNHIAHAQR